MNMINRFFSSMLICVAAQIGIAQNRILTDIVVLHNGSELEGYISRQSSIEGIDVVSRRPDFLCGLPAVESHPSARKSPAANSYSTTLSVNTARFGTCAHRATDRRYSIYPRRITDSPLSIWPSVFLRPGPKRLPMRIWRTISTLCSLARRRSAAIQSSATSNV